MLGGEAFLAASSAAGQAASYSSGVSAGSRPCCLRVWTAMNSALPPSMMSVPRPAMLVATVTAPLRPAMATTAASRSCCLALRTWCGMPFFFSSAESVSDFSTLVVPTRTGWPAACRSAMSSTIAVYFCVTPL